MLKHGEIHELPKMDLFTFPVELDLMGWTFKAHPLHLHNRTQFYGQILSFDSSFFFWVQSLFICWFFNDTPCMQLELLLHAKLWFPAFSNLSTLPATLNWRITCSFVKTTELLYHGGLAKLITLPCIYCRPNNTTIAVILLDTLCVQRTHVLCLSIQGNGA